MMTVLKKVWITERAVADQANGKYVFQVAPNATKNEVKKAVETLYHVKVRQVNIVQLPPKPRRFRNRIIRKPGPKKAVVSLKEGQTIDLGTHAA
jgi:large subunit ribosomal protein L23